MFTVVFFIFFINNIRPHCIFNTVTRVFYFKYLSDEIFVMTHLDWTNFFLAMEHNENNLSYF